MTRRLSAGSPEPLGATPTAEGVNFAVRSGSAEAVEVCLFDGAGERELERIRLPERTGDVFHGHVAGLRPGARYGLRAYGPYAPDAGHRFNPFKLLVDPYAAVLDRPFRLHPSMFGYRRGDPDADLSFDDADSGPHMPKAVAAASAPPIRPAAGAPWGRSVIYEMHVKGFSRLNPDVPEAARGTFAGLAAPAVLDHLHRLGVTAVELMPAAAWIDERHLGPLGLSNYWGYNPVAWMAPDPRLAPGGWDEVAAAAAALAGIGIEALYDVVLNHTGEGDHLGPTLCLRGLDNAGYYRLSTASPRYYVDDSGCGNTLALDRPAGMRLAMDALRAWTRRGGASGFRFDLATVMGRRPDGFDPDAPLLHAIAQDPELSALKLIAEPWDCGPGAHRLGAFPAGWGEWNDRFRDAVRRYWRGDDGLLGEFAGRLSGSEDIFGPRRRPPSRSVNFVVAHDGFTLADLVAYERKHNEANGEENRDGSSHEVAWNHGAEGATDDPDILALRRRDQRALLASLFLARGTPMLTMGMELGQSQGGNNNAYAQDNAIAWLDWDGADAALAAYVGRLTRLRAELGALHGDRFLTGRPSASNPWPDAAWLRLDGTPMTPDDWTRPGAGSVVLMLADPAGTADDPGRAVLVFHRDGEPALAVLPAARPGFAWRIALDSADDGRVGLSVEDAFTLAPRSATVLVEEPLAPRAAVDDPAALDRLAAAAGIAPDWWSVEGVRHGVAPDTQRALLAAMGLPAASNGEVRESLERLSQARDRRPLPFALVRTEGRDAALPIPLGNGPHPLWLTIQGEDGAVRRERVHAAATREAVALDGTLVRIAEAPLPPLPAGRYRLSLDDQPEACALTVAPEGCWRPPGLADGGRMLGLTAQLYALRRPGDQGVGDFTTLSVLAAAAAHEGLQTVGLNPLHALFPGDPGRASPYHPSDRRFLNPLYLDLDRIEGAGGADVPPPGPAVDYAAVWAAKGAALERAFAAGPGGQDADFDAFVAGGGPALERFATFEAISETRKGEPWARWPAGLRDARGGEVAAFAAPHAARVRFHQWLQWLCDRQLGAAARDAAGLALGFYRDLAVGAAPDGAEAWAEADTLAHGVSIGAPPDPFSATGQVWGLPPPIPHRWTETGYEAFAGLLRANMRHAGALRLDHVMGLARLFWVPEGADGASGAYVAYPFADLMGQVALESRRARCLVVGEDLGTVPDGLREAMAAGGMLAYRALAFEREGARYRPPSEWPREAAACVANHDLPPLAGWWTGVDIAEAVALGTLAPEDAEAARADRAADRDSLLAALIDAGLIATADSDGELDDALAAAIHAYVSATPCALALVQADDLAGETVPVNLPGTDAERPNWRRRVSAPVPDLFASPRARAILAAMRAARKA